MTVNRFKTKPRDHQLKAFELSEGKDAYAYLMEMGTGKTKSTIDDAARAWGLQQIDSLLVFAPNGVHLAWTIEQVPTHMPEWVRYRMAAWSSKTTKAVEQRIDDITAISKGGELRILTVNWDAIAHKRGFNAVKLFCETSKGLMIVADESQRIKNPKAERSKALFKLKKFSRMRRIMSGSPLLNAPFDLFNQFLFLDESILGTTSFYAFKTQYADMLQPGNKLLDRIVEKRTLLSVEDAALAKRSLSELRAILESNGRATLIEAMEQLESLFDNKNYDLVAQKTEDMRGMFAPGFSKSKMSALLCLGKLDNVCIAQANKARAAHNPHRLPQIVEKDKEGRPKYKNLERLRALIQPYSFRVLKSECLDLPPKIYKKVWYELTSEQEKAYKKMKQEARIILEDGSETPVAKLAAIMKLSQICSGYVNLPAGAGMMKIPGDNPKLEALEDALETNVDAGIKSIIWARFTPEIDEIAALCEKRGWTYAKYNGSTKGDDRPIIAQRFERGELDVFIGEQRTGGTGITLVRAGYVGYYSNNFSSEDRQQSEDRAHRDGQTKSVVYADFLGVNSCEPGILQVLYDKKSLSDVVIDGKMIEALLGQL